MLGRWRIQWSARSWTHQIWMAPVESPEAICRPDGAHDRHVMCVPHPACPRYAERSVSPSTSHTEIVPRQTLATRLRTGDHATNDVPRARETFTRSLARSTIRTVPLVT